MGVGLGLLGPRARAKPEAAKPNRNAHSVLFGQSGFRLWASGMHAGSDAASAQASDAMFREASGCRRWLPGSWAAGALGQAPGFRLWASGSEASEAIRLDGSRAQRARAGSRLSGLQALSRLQS